MRLSAVHSLTDAPNVTAQRPAPSGFGLIARVSAWLKRRAILAELHELDERTLADLRIHAGDFQAIADGTYAREGGAHDVALEPGAGPANSDHPARPYY